MAQRKDESSSEFFERLRPKFLDWQPPTEEERAREAQARRDAKAAELKRVTDLANAKEAQRKGVRRGRRGRKASR